MDPDSSPTGAPAQLQELRRWCSEALGRQLAEAEQAVLDDILGDIFGYHLVVVDPSCQTESLAASRIIHRVVQTATPAGLAQTPGLIGLAEHLPLQSDSIDAFVLPHVLEHARDPHQVLREIDRCLVPEGHVIILGFNPFGWWGLRRLLFGWRGQIPWSLRFISLPRAKDWLSLLGFDAVKTAYFFPHAPWRSRREGTADSLLKSLHRSHWPLLAAAWVLVARKRVATLTPIKPRWRPRRALLAGGVAETRQGGLHTRG